MFKEINLCISVAREVPIWIQQITTFEKSLFDIISSVSERYEDSEVLKTCHLRITLMLTFESETGFGHWKKVRHNFNPDPTCLYSVAEDIIHRSMPIFEASMVGGFGLRIHPDGYRCCIGFIDPVGDAGLIIQDISVYKEMTFNKKLIAQNKRK